MNARAGYTDAWLWLTIPIVILLVIAAGGGILIEGLSRDNPYYVAQAIGQDYISLIVVLPTLIATAFLAGRGSAQARLIWLGSIVRRSSFDTLASSNQHSDNSSNEVTM
jgi:hypothetical protein